MSAPLTKEYDAQLATALILDDAWLVRRCPWRPRAIALGRSTWAVRAKPARRDWAANSESEAGWRDRDSFQPVLGSDGETFRGGTGVATPAGKS